MELTKKTNWTIEKVRDFIWREAQCVLLSTEYVNIKTKMKARCPAGDVWDFTIKSFRDGDRCKYCYDRIRGWGLFLNPGKELTRYTNDEIKNLLKKEGYDLVSTDYHNIHSKIQCKCPQSHDWSITWDRFRKGQRCKFCNAIQRKEKKRVERQQKQISCRSNRLHWTIDSVRDYLKKEGYDLVSTEYKTCKSMMVAQCPKGSLWNFRLNDFQQKHRCPCCISSRSRGECEVGKLFKHLSPIVGDRSIASPYELDLYFPIQKVGVEYCGLYWHSDAAPGDRITSNYHRNKLDLCAKQNVRLLTIFEDEWLNHKDICISRINSALGIVQNKIFARKCEVRQVSSGDAYKFLKQTHLQGAGTCKIAYGLFYNNRLVQVMTFGSPARAHTSKGKKVLEMKRLAGELNTIIVGGASKLFKFGLQYAKDNNYEIVKSYCDLRWGTGNLYAKLGFTKTYETKYTLHYTDLKGRFRNQTLAQNKQKTGKTEAEVSQQKGLFKIYDCGHQTWEYEIK